MPSDFNSQEISSYDGRPVVLFEFFRHSGNDDFYWRYNNTESNFVYLANSFKGTNISDGGITQTGEAQSSQLTITMPMAEDFPTMFRTNGNTPSDVVWITIWRTHSGLADDARVIWAGSVASMSQTDEVTAEIVCNVLMASFKRSGLRLPWTRGCPHATYDSQCRLDKFAFQTTGEIVEFTNTTVTVAEFAFKEDGYFAGGFIEWGIASGMTERRYIKSHIGDTLTIGGSTFGMVVGETMAAYAGDDHTAQTCSNKFDNILNYGGFTEMPGKSPFDGDPVF